MRDTIVGYEVSKLLKEIGYDGENKTQYFYSRENSLMFRISESGNTVPILNTTGRLYTIGLHAALCSGDMIHAPTQSLAQKWFRDTHNIHVSVYNWGSNVEEFHGHYYPIFDYNFLSTVSMEVTEDNEFTLNINPPSFFNTYEEALEDGLKQSCLKVKGVHEGKHQ